MLKDFANTGLGAISNLARRVRDSQVNDLIEYTKPARVEPIVLIDSSLRHHDECENILQLLTNMYAGYYIYAAQISANIGNIDVIKFLDKLSPDRDLLGGSNISTESYDDADALNVSMEARPERRGREGRREKPDAVINSKDMAVITDANNLSVGKQVMLTIKSGDSTGTIPINIRLMAKVVSGAGYAELVSNMSADNSMVGRYHRWRAGELSAIRDMILCQDIIESEKKLALLDKDQVFATIKKRNAKNQAAVLSGKGPSVNTVSSIVVIDQRTAAKVESSIGSKLKRFRARETLMSNSLAMMLVVVDTDWGVVTIYQRGIAEELELSFKELKFKNKSNGPDISEILSAYRAGTSPNL